MAFGQGKNRRRVDTAQRKAEVTERARTHGPLILRFLGLVTVCAALVYGGHTTWRWAIASPFFGLKTLNFVGLDHATGADLRRLSALAAGQNLFLLEPAALERAMGQHPWIKAVDVRRQFPATVHVTVVEHVPVAVTSLGELYLVDAEGEPFKRVQVGDTVDFPLVTGLTREDFVQDPLETAERLRSALTLAEAYREAKLDQAEALSEVRLESDRVTLVTGKDGQEVRLPLVADEQVLSRLAKVRAELARRSVRAEVIHLDNRGRPAWVAVKVSAPVSERNGRSVQ